METSRVNPPRTFKVGNNQDIEISECLKIELQQNEQVTFISNSKEYDFVRKDWGYYASPSLNGRLSGFGLKGVLVKSIEQKFFFLIVEKGKEILFENYLKSENLKIVTWLDSSPALNRLDELLNGK